MAIFYIPFDQTTADQAFGTAGQNIVANTGKQAPWWKLGIGSFKSFEQRNIRVLYRDSQQDLSSAGGGTNIYITGHGEPGSLRIRATLDAVEPSLSPTDLALQLDDRRLPKSFFGSIRVLACSAGSGDFSFAQQFSVAMGVLGYRFCNIYGYTLDIGIAEDLEHIRSNPGMEDATSYSKLAGNAIEGTVAGTASQFRRRFDQNKNPFNR
jgi:hypothetical protein